MRWLERFRDLNYCLTFAELAALGRCYADLRPFLHIWTNGAVRSWNFRSGRRSDVRQSRRRSRGDSE